MIYLIIWKREITIERVMIYSLSSEEGSNRIFSNLNVRSTYMYDFSVVDYYDWRYTCSVQI